MFVIVCYVAFCEGLNLSERNSNILYNCVAHNRHCVVQLSVCACERECMCVRVNQPATFLSSDTPLSLWSRVITLAVSLADVAGTGPKDRLEGVKTIPTKWHELMCLINTTLIICKLHVWLHVTWEAYAARTVSPPTSASYSASKLPSMWRRANTTVQEKSKKKSDFCVQCCPDSECLLSLFALNCPLSCLLLVGRLLNR